MEARGGTIAVQNNASSRGASFVVTLPVRFDTIDATAENHVVGRLLRGVVTVVALVGLTASTWGTCVEGATSSAAQQMACCKKGHHTCGKDGAPADCCKTDGAKPHDVITIAKVEPARSHAPVAMVWALLPEVTVLDCGHRPFRQAASPPIPSLSPPPYIAFSALLI
jgi:hypothetical protein